MSVASADGGLVAISPDRSVRGMTREVSTTAAGSSNLHTTRCRSPTTPNDGDEGGQHAIWVLDQLLIQHGADAQFYSMLGKVQLMEHMANGLYKVGLASALSGYFEDQGEALAMMISNLRNGIRARSWK